MPSTRSCLSTKRTRTPAVLVFAHPIAAAAQAAHDVLVAQYPDQHAKLGGSARPLARSRPGRRAARPWNCAWPGHRGGDPCAARGRRLGFPRHLSIPARSRPVSNDAAMERLRGATWISVRETVRARVRAPVPAGRRRRRCGPRHTRARSAKSKSTAQQTARVVRTIRPPMPSGGWSSPKGLSIALRDNWRSIATCISGRRPACLRTSAWRFTTRTSRPGTRNTSTTTGVRTRPFERRTPTRTRARRPTPTGSRCVRRRRFPSTRSAHAAACGASFGVLQQTFGHRGSFTMETTTAPPGMPTRTFASFRCGGGRVCGLAGEARLAFPVRDRRWRRWHLVLGKQVARYTLSHSLQTLRELILLFLLLVLSFNNLLVGGVFALIDGVPLSVRT